MKRTSRPLRWLCLLLTMMLVLTSCGPSPNHETTPAPETDTPVIETTQEMTPETTSPVAEDIPAILESRIRENAGETVPAKGLCLMEVRYP